MADVISAGQEMMNNFVELLLIVLQMSFLIQEMLALERTILWQAFMLMVMMVFFLTELLVVAQFQTEFQVQQ